MPYCSNCGKAVAFGGKFCPNCGAPQVVQQSAAPPAASSAFTPPPKSRPPGVTILVIANFVLGVAAVVLGFLFLSLPPPYTAVQVALAVILLLLGILSLATGQGYRRARPWAWVPGILTAVIYVGIGLLLVGTGAYLFGLPSVVLGATTIYFLNTKPIKIYLDRT